MTIQRKAYWFAFLLGFLASFAFAQQAPTVTYPPILLRDEGVDKGRITKALDFVGATVTCTFASGVGTCTISAGASITVTEVEIDFGTAIAYFDKQFTITDAAVGTGSKILITQSGNAATGRQADENQMDTLICNALPAAGSFTLFCTAAPGPVTGKYKIFYTIG